MLERVRACFLCGSQDYWPLFTVKKTVSVVKCPGCGLLYVNPRPTDEEFRNIYQNESYFKNKNVLLYGYDDYMKEEPLYRDLFKRCLEDLEQYKPKGTMLDVGCATGFFLDVAQSRGWETYGVEISKFASGYAREHFKLNIFTGTLAEAKLQSGMFDAVVMYDQIEHVREPLEQLQEAYRLLKPGGILTINTPNAGGLLSKIMRRRWFHFKEDHLFFFSNTTISKALAAAGFQVLKVKPSGKVVTLRYLIGRLNHYSRFLARFLDYLLGEFRFVNKAFYLYIGEMVVYAKKP